MGWSQLSKPGTQYGPCVEKCQHQDCAWSRQIAASVCRICGEPIGYERPFYTDPQYRGLNGQTYVHAGCLQDEVEREQREEENERQRLHA